MWHGKAFLTLVFLFALPLSAWSKEFCFNEAAERYGVSADLLARYSKHESNGNPYAVHWNANGTYDYCHMQINSSWYEVMRKRHGKETADQWWSGLADPCKCTKAGADILSSCIRKFGLNWRGLGCYNATTDSKRLRYAITLLGLR